MNARGGGVAAVNPALDALYRDKAMAELSSADRMAPGLDAIRWSGDVFAEVFLIKGDPGPAEVSGGAALSGPDGEAAAKALGALGFDPADVFATVARPETGIDPGVLAERLRVQVESVDPYAVVALDPIAADVLCAAFMLGTLKPGRVRHAQGRAHIALSGLEAALADDLLKRKVWQQLKSLAPRQPSL